MSSLIQPRYQQGKRRRHWNTFKNHPNLCRRRKETCTLSLLFVWGSSNDYVTTRQLRMGRISQSLWMMRSIPKHQERIDSLRKWLMVRAHWVSLWLINSEDNIKSFRVKTCVERGPLCHILGTIRWKIWFFEKFKQRFKKLNMSQPQV